MEWSVCVDAVGEANELGQRQHVMSICALMVLQFQIYNAFDVKLTKQVWDLHKRVSHKLLYTLVCHPLECDMCSKLPPWHSWQHMSVS